MPIVTKTKTHSKCRAWEQERRNRLGLAFSNLAAILPANEATSTSPSTTVAPNTKILILQHSLRYIQQLQASLNKPREAGVDVAVETEEILDEASVLRSKCWELVKVLIEARLPLPTPPPTRCGRAAGLESHKTEEQSTTKKPKGSGEDTKKSHIGCSVYGINESCVGSPVLDDQVDVCEKECKKTKKQNRKSKGQRKQQSGQASNVRGAKGGKEKRSCKKKSTINRKHTRKKSAGSQARVHTITSTSNVWIANAALRGQMVLPLLPQVLPPAPSTIFINPFPFPLLTTPRKLLTGFDITKTTMVNKVPIPTTALDVGVKQLPKVTHRSKLKMIKTMNNMKGKLATRDRKKTNLETQNISKKVENSPQSESESAATTHNQNGTTSSNLLEKQDTENEGNGKRVSSKCNQDSNPPLLTAKTMPKSQVNKVESIQFDRGKELNQCKEVGVAKKDELETGITKDQNKPAPSQLVNTKALELEQAARSEITARNDGSGEKLPENSANMGGIKLFSNGVNTCTNGVLKELPRNNSSSACMNELSATNCAKGFTKEFSGNSGVGELSRNNTNVNSSKELLANSSGSGYMRNNTSGTKEQCANSAITGEVKEFSGNNSVCMKFYGNSANSGTMKEFLSNASNISCIKENAFNKRKKVEDPSEVREQEQDRQEIGGDMAEEISLPSPTAAFLLTFPLVCSGPSEPLPPPQDNFSSYFPREMRDSAHVSNANNVFLPNDCQSAAKMNSESTKTTWSSAHNVTIYSKTDSHLKSMANLEQSSTSVKDVSKAVTSSSACIFSGTQNVFASSLPSNASYPFSDSIFNYEHTPVSGAIRDGAHTTSTYPQNIKVPFNYDSLHANDKIMNNASSYEASGAPNTLNHHTSNPFSYNGSSGSGVDNKSLASAPVQQYSAKRPYDNSCKLTFPNTANRKDSSCTKAVFSNSTATATATNSYNPFDLPITPTPTPTTLGVSKSSNMYFPDFSSNIPQSCNLWSEDTNAYAYGVDFAKPDVKKPTNSNSLQNYSSGLGLETQPDFRYSVSSKQSVSEVSHKHGASKSVKAGSKISVRDSKYLIQDSKESKLEYPSQKAPINWMTSEVSFANTTQDLFSNNSQKDVRSVLPGANQCALDSALSIPGLSSSSVTKKSEFYEQPFYMPSGSFVAQPLHEDNQFTWSPSKLIPLSEAAPLVPSSLPTLVGDLALSMGDAKQTYQHLFLEQTEMSKNIGEKKNVQQKNKPAVKSNKATCEVNSTSGTFLSVSQIMDRGKEDSGYLETSGCPINTRNGLHYTPNRNTNLGNGNKSGEMPIFSGDPFGVQQMSDYFPPPLHKVTQKNSYSTESLLQPNDHYIGGGSKATKALTKSYDASTLCLSSEVNPLQHAGPNGNNSMEVDHFSHTNLSNSYCYPASVNTPLYTSSSYLATGPTTASYPSYPLDTNDYNTNVDNSLYTKMEPCPPTDASKYHFDGGRSLNSVHKQTKTETLKRDTGPKRQRKNKAVPTEGYVPGSQRCYSMSSGGCGEEGVYGYQAHVAGYTPNMPSHKNTVPQVKLAQVSPGHSGTSSLANFNLSTIFPEINKRPAMSGYPESLLKPSMSAYI